MVQTVMRHPALRILSLGSLLMLSACGFAPLYSQQGLTVKLSQVAVEVPETRTGYFLEQGLKNDLAIDPSLPAIYSLKITMKESHYSIGYRVNDTSTRSEITNNVSYVLKNIETGKIIFQKSFVDTVTYDTSSSPFTGVVSQQDAQKRVAASSAQKIETDLAVYFHDAK